MAQLSASVTPATLRSVVDRGFPELFGWLGEHEIAIVGPPYIRYLEVDDDGAPLEIALGAPVAGPVAGDGAVRGDELPAGRYATLLHVGPYSSATEPDIAAARVTLADWMHAGGHRRAARSTPRGTALVADVEHYRTDARSEPDHSKWETEITVLVADD